MHFSFFETTKRDYTEVNRHITNREILIIAAAIVLAAAAVVCWLWLKPETKSEVVKTEQQEPEKPFRYDDMQPVQLEAAQKWGVTPVEKRDTDFSKIPQLRKIETCDLYYVEYLAHSVPYLTPHAKELLERIARDFQDSLRVLGVTPHRIIITSVLRTMDDVRRLQRVNGNAVPQSSHCYGTTFDIAHNCFYTVDPNVKDGQNGKFMSYADMKRVLGHVLFRLRMKHMCLVIMENTQPCYHVTVNY